MRELSAKLTEGESFGKQSDVFAMVVFSVLSLRHGFAVPPPSSEGGIGCYRPNTNDRFLTVCALSFRRGLFVSFLLFKMMKKV